MTFEELQATIDTWSDKLRLAGCEIASGDGYDKGFILQRDAIRESGA
jgi:hypothetical protein